MTTRTHPHIRIVVLALAVMLAFGAALATTPPADDASVTSGAQPILARTRGPQAISFNGPAYSGSRHEAITFNGPARTGVMARGHDGIVLNGPDRTGLRLP